MNKWIALSFLITLPLWADHHEEKGKSFDEKKAHFTQSLDKRISLLNEAKACVQSSTDVDGLKGCHKKMKEERESMKSQRKERKEKLNLKK